MAEEKSNDRPKPFTGEWLQNIGQASWIAAKDFFRDDGPYWAASISYYTLLSAIPVLLLLALAASLAIDSSDAVERLSGVAGDLLPEGEDQVREIVEASYDGRGVAGFFSVVLLLWSGTHVFGAISRALNVAYNISAQTSVLRLFTKQVVMLISVSILLVLGLLSRELLDQIWSIRGISEEDRTIVFSVLRNVLPLAFSILAFFLIYRFVPEHRPTWIPALTGAIIASVAFFVARELFVVYQQNFASFDQVYGPLALLIAILFWVWICGVILLVGGQLVAHYQEILVDGEDPDDVEERHREAKQKRDQPREGA